MKKIGNFLFVEQSFTDTEKTKIAVININCIDNITCRKVKEVGEDIVIETNNTEILVKDTNNTFFAEFEEVLKNEEEW